MSSSDIAFTDRGPVLPTTGDVRAAVLEDWQAAFDNRLNPDPATPQGQLITTRIKTLNWPIWPGSSTRPRPTAVFRTRWPRRAFFRSG